MREYRKKNKEKLAAKQLESRKDNAIQALWRQISRRKDKLNILREVFVSTYSVPDTCPVLGIPISYELDRDNFPSVDRLDPNLPYEVGNITVVSYRANMIKSVGSAEEHEQIAQWLSEQSSTKILGKSLGPAPLQKTTVRFGRKRERIN